MSVDKMSSSKKNNFVRRSTMIVEKIQKFDEINKKNELNELSGNTEFQKTLVDTTKGNKIIPEQA